MIYDPDIAIETDEDVYPPSEDSILLIESLDVRPGERVLEIGCGSGVVSIHCAKNSCVVTAGDINPKAVELARRNAERNGAEMDVIETDVYSNIEGVFDTIVFNLPYLPVDEEGLLAKAWSGGPPSSRSSLLIHQHEIRTYPLDERRIRIGRDYVQILLQCTVEPAVKPSDTEIAVDLTGIDEDVHIAVRSRLAAGI